jgi:fatty-acyl-CoA synthase
VYHQNAGRRDEDARRRMQACPHPLAMLEQVAERAPDREAFVHLRDARDEAGVVYSYADALDIGRRIAAGIQTADLGAAPVVAILAPSIPDTLLALAAIASVGAAFPVNTLLSAEAIAGQFRLAGVTAVVAFGAHPVLALDRTVAEAIRLAGGVRLIIELEAGCTPSPALAATGVRRVGWSDFLTAADPAQARPDAGRRAAALFHTGGTTGAPKLAELGVDALMASLHCSAVGGGWREDDRVLQLLPFFHVGGALIAGLGLFSGGATLITCGLAGARDPQVIANIWEIAERMEATLVGLVPPSWSMVAAAGAPPRPPRLRALLTGATAMAPELARRMSAMTGVPMAQMLGMTELSGAGSNQPVGEPGLQPAVGHLAPLIEAQLRPISPGGPTELLVRGPMLFSGYRTVDGLVSPLVDGWYATGDLAEQTDDGQLLLSGRVKDVIIRSGHNIDPSMIEEVVSQHPDVVLAAAVGMPDAFAGELPVVYAVARPGATVVEAALADFVSERIDEPPARPKRITFLDQLPLTAVGKVARYKLRQQATVTCVRELLHDLEGIADVACEDVGARQVTITWDAPADAGIATAEDRLAPLGLRATHVKRSN